MYETLGQWPYYSKTSFEPEKRPPKRGWGKVRERNREYIEEIQMAKKTCEKMCNLLKK